MTLRKIPMSGPGWCPFAEHYPMPGYLPGDAPSKGFFEEFYPARAAAVMHIVVGSFLSCIYTFGEGTKSSHFLISKQGRLVQFVNIYHGAWANGLTRTQKGWMSPEGHLVRPTWAGIYDDVNPNKYTWSFEHEGYPREPWTSQMFDTQVRTLRWLQDQPKVDLVWDPHTTLIGHYEINPVDRASCPGPYCDFRTIAARANERPDAHGTYDVIAPAGAVVRQGPGTRFERADALSQGTSVEVDMVTMGDPWNGSRAWAHLASGLGFIHTDLLEMAA